MDIIEGIENINELPVATLDDTTTGKTIIMCGEDHPFDCKKYGAIKVTQEHLTQEHGNLVVVSYAWLGSEQPMCELIGKGN